MQDEVRFMVVNIYHKLPRMANPFIFLSHATQVFSSNVPNKLGWKVVLRKEARSKHRVVDTTDVFITTTLEASDFGIPIEVQARPLPILLVGAIEFFVEEDLIASATY